MKKILHDFIKNYLGFKTKRKILVFESDDWGSNRMPSNAIFEQLRIAGIIHNNMRFGDRYDRFDTIASESDLHALFEVLHCVKDQYGSAAKFTPISVLANPDYSKIRVNGFEKYEYELFTDYLRERGDFDSVMHLWREGIRGGYFVPQFHGREHLNVTKWMNALKEGDNATLYCFDRGVYGAPTYRGGIFLAAYDYNKPEELNTLAKITAEGLHHFREIFGFQATYFVPPNGPLSCKLHGYLNDLGIDGLQTARLVYLEPIGGGKYKRRLRFFGQKNVDHQHYFLRNAIFEPNEPSLYSPIEKCLSDIAAAFHYEKPAVVSTHRVNYIGVLDENNRKRSLETLKSLLIKILDTWPDVEFMTSGELLSVVQKEGKGI